MNSDTRKADLKAGGMAPLVKYLLCKHEVPVFEPQNLYKNVGCGIWGDRYGRGAPSSTANQPSIMVDSRPLREPVSKEVGGGILEDDT